MRKTLLWSFLLSILFVGLASAQEKTVRGTVTASNTGEPLPGVNVVVEGTQTGTATDAQGAYQLEVPGPDAVLVFNFVGFQTEQVQVGDRTVIDVALQEDVAQLEEVIVTGYGTQERQAITGSVSQIDAAEANVGQKSSPQDLLRGRVAGVNVQDNSAEPGTGSSIRIRGTSSISAGNDPLYVVDGVPITNTNVTPGTGTTRFGTTSSSDPLDLINPNDIKSIQVLKDASATAIYGSEGANGVIVIETKEGRAGSIEASYSGKVTTSTFANELDLITGDQFRKATSCNTNLGDFETFDQCFQEREGDFSGVNTDWQQAATRTAVTHEHNLSLSGGGESTSYRASASYLDQQGLVLENSIERATGRLRVIHRQFDNRLTLGLNLTGSFATRKHVFAQGGDNARGAALKGLIGFGPSQPIKREDGMT